ncbi:MAG: anhydro-N-acetylmuramic acid kinase [Phycisphaerales bacterium]|nr:anhydro-N-acetylmuramic acid kinase [Phycisphaerales bacterium]
MRTAIGLMTGTSIDGIDAAAVRVVGSGLALRAELLAHEHAPLGALAATLRALACGERMTAAEISAAALALGRLHADLASRLAQRVGPPDLVAAHGQTVFHAPPRSFQLLSPAPIADALRCPVVYDLRAADLAAGGQGAPITPVADFVFFRDPAQARAVVNLGGFCNVTLLPPRAERDEGAWLGAVRGRDICACNHVLDAAARRALGKPFDDGGAGAFRGAPDPNAVRDLRDALGAQSRIARSLGSGDESLAWIERHADGLAPDNLLASAASAVGEAIGAALRDFRPDLVLVAGGGTRNRALVGHIQRAVGAPVQPTDEFGVPVGAREAAAMAVLGALCADGVPITLPAVTGVRSPAPVSGAWMNAPALLRRD